MDLIMLLTIALNMILKESVLDANNLWKIIVKNKMEFFQYIVEKKHKIDLSMFC